MNKILMQALENYLFYTGKSKSDLANELNISHTTVSRWISGEIHPSGLSRKKLLKKLKNYLPAEMQYSQNADFSTIHETQKKHEMQENKEVPIIGWGSAKSFEPAIEPVEDFVSNNVIGYNPNPTSNGNLFCIKVEGDSMSPVLPHGSIVYIDTTDLFPRRGNLVVARLKDVGVIIKKYYRKDNIIYLNSINKTGENYEIRIKQEPGKLLFLWKIKYHFVNTDDQQWERIKNGYNY